MNKNLSNKNEEHESLEPSAALVNIHNNVYIRSDFQSFRETEFNLWYIQMRAQLVRLSLSVLGAKVPQLYMHFLWPQS